MIYYTNKRGLPKQIVDMMEKNFRSYDKGDSLSITQLISSPQIVQLKDKHKLWMDYTELWAAFVGSLLHKALEDNSENGIKEVRLFYDFGGTTISGQIDFYDPATRTLRDYKTGGEVRLFQFAKSEWEQQLNCYAWLLRNHGMPVDRIQVRRFAVDWRLDSKNSDVPCDDVEIPVWTHDAVEEFIKQRIELHQQKPTPPCTTEDMWERPTRYAVMQKGKKRALRVLDSFDEAEEWCSSQNLTVDSCEGGETLKPGIDIEERFGERVRCERYCVCAQKCEQFKEYKQNASV